MVLIASVFAHFILTLIILFLFTTKTTWFRESHKSVELGHVVRNISLNLVINFTILITITYNLSLLNFKVNYIFTIFILTIFLLKIISVVKKKNSNRQFESRKYIKIKVKILSYSTAVATFFYFPALYKSILYGPIFNMATIGNNDIVNYALTAREFLETGFTNTENFDKNLNNYARSVQHQSSNTFIAFIAWIFRFQTWQIMNLSMLTILSFGIITLFYFTTSVSPYLSGKKLVVISAISFGNIFMVYVTGGYFHAQVLSIFLSFTTWALLYEIIIKKSLLKLNLSALTALVAAAIFTYPVWLLLNIILVIAILYFLDFIKNSKIDLKNLKKILLPIFAGFVISITYIPNTVTILKILSEGEFGWPLPRLNPFGIFISYQYLVSDSSNLIFYISWLVFFALCLRIVFKKNVPFELRWLFGILLIATIAVFYTFLEVRDQSITEYSSWKFFSYLTYAIISLFLIIHFLNNQWIDRLVISLLFISSLSAPFQVWAAPLKWKELTVNHNMKIAADKALEYKLKNLNIDVSPFFDSMAMALLLPNTKIHFNSVTYYPISKNPSACTIVRKDTNPYLLTSSLSLDYGLTASDNFVCTPSNLANSVETVEINKVYKMGTERKGNKFLISGWSLTEDWGVWAEGTKAEIAFKIPQETLSKELLIQMQFNYFNPDAEDSRIYYEVFINDRYVDRFYIKNKADEKIQINYLHDNKVTTDPVKINFRIYNSVSPKSLNLSGDDRLLGIGIRSFEVVYNKEVE